RYVTSVIVGSPAPPSTRRASGTTPMRRDSGTSRRSRDDEVCATDGDSLEGGAGGAPVCASGARGRGGGSMGRVPLAAYGGVRGGGGGGGGGSAAGGTGSRAGANGATS